MRRWGLALVLVLAAWAISSTVAHGIERSKRNPKRTAYPPRYTRDTMAQWYVFRNREGETTKTVKSYPGYGEHFPPPAYLFYGYPKSGDFTGMGIDGTP